MTPLRQRMTEDMRLRNLGLSTQRAYLQYVAQFAGYFHRSPEMLGPAEIRAFQLHLSRDRQLSASSVGVAVAALRFLYKVTLQRGWNLDDVIPTGRQPQRLPVILSPQEVAGFLDAVGSLTQLEQSRGAERKQHTEFACFCLEKPGFSAQM